MNVRRVRSRPAGLDDPFDTLFEDFSLPVDPPPSFIGSAGVPGLDEGGTMFIDDIVTFNLRDPASTLATNLINQAVDEEINGFILLSSNPAEAKRLIEGAVAKIIEAEQAISSNSEFQQGTRYPQALAELAKARQFDQQALEAIVGGNTTQVGDLLINAAEAKARAKLFLDGHNPLPGPFPDGLGGFDAGDPIFADGFESGDVSAWSTGEPTSAAPSDKKSYTGGSPGSTCQPDETTLCLPQGERFQATIDWRDFTGSTGSGQVSTRFNDGGVFYFFNPANTDLVVRLLDRCKFNDHFWVFAAATTNVEYTLTVTDTHTSETKSYFNPLGMPGEPILDTSAFATCP